MDLYVADKLAQAETEGVRGRILELGELCTLKLADIRVFYGADDSPEQEKP